MEDKRKFSHSSMKTWRRCRYKYYLHYVENYDPPPSRGLVRGSVGHAGLEAYYRNINLPFDEKVALGISAASDKLWSYSDNFQEEWELMNFLLLRYFDWAKENDPFTEVLAMEQKFSLKLGDHTLIGYIDGIVNVKGTNWLLESKFLSSVSTKNLPLDIQVSIYLLAARELGYNPRGVYYNIIRTTKGGIAESKPVVRLPTYRNHEGLEVLKRELIAQMDLMQNFHNGNLIVFRNPTKDCSWDCGFYDVCLSLNDNGTSQKVLNLIPIKEIIDDPEEEGDEDE